MNIIESTSSETVLKSIAKNKQWVSNTFINGNIKHLSSISYRVKSNKQSVCYNSSSRLLNVELILTLNEASLPWLYIDESTIKNAGRGLFASRNFSKHQYFSVYLGKKISQNDIILGRFSNHAFSDRDPCDENGRAFHWFMLAQFINHGNYTKSNCQFDPKLRGYTTKAIRSCNELIMDYNRTIYCTTCYETEQQGIKRKNRMACKPCVRGLYGICSYCCRRRKQLVLRYCPRCRRKLCASCYDKIQISL